MDIFGERHIIQRTTQTQEHSSLAAVLHYFPLKDIELQRNLITFIQTISCFLLFLLLVILFFSLPRIPVLNIKFQLKSFYLPESCCYPPPSLRLMNQGRILSFLYPTSVFYIAPIFFSKNLLFWNKFRLAAKWYKEFCSLFTQLPQIIITYITIA